ncbi:MAG: HlyD family efflux transporter periplasmic adaptor subunit [Oscillospiraceae bacterium]
MAKTTENTDRISERRKKRERRTKLSWIPKVLIILLAIYFIVMIISGFNKSVKTYIAQTGVIEEFVSTEGYIFRNQELIKAPKNGFFEAEISEGDRVNEGTTVACIYQNSVDPAVTAEIRDIREEIKSITENPKDNDVYANTSVRVEQRIASTANELSLIRATHNMSEISNVKSTLNKLIDKKLSFTGEGVPKEKILSGLNEKLKTLEAGLNGEKTELTTTKSGIFSSKIDGLEDDLRIEALDKITPEYLDNLDNKEISYSTNVQEGQPVCKVVNNYNWYFVSNVDEGYAKNLSIGQSVRLRFYDLTDSAVYGIIKGLSAPENGKVAVSVSTNRYVESIYSTSRAAAELLTAKYEGIKIPSQSLRVIDGQTGVYVARLDVAHFVPVDVKYKNSEWAIVSSINNTKSEYKLQIYDEVIVDCKNLEDGKVVR